jgi:hypothetical protein
MFEVGQEVTLMVDDRPRGIGRIDRVTKTQAIVFGRKFRMHDGYEVGGYHGPRIAVTTEDHKNRIIRQKAISYIRNTRWDELPLEALIEIRNKIESAAKGGE